MSNRRCRIAALLAVTLGMVSVGHATDYYNPNSNPAPSPNATPAPDQPNNSRGMPGDMPDRSAPSAADSSTSPGSNQPAHDDRCQEKSASGSDYRPCPKLPKPDSGSMSD
jgi:hypothetical protein